MIQHQVGIRMPDDWFEALTAHANRTVERPPTRGQQGKLSFWIREAIRQRAAREGIALDDGKSIAK